jgi:hypothetical protein
MIFHGSIHLLGAAKGLGLADVTQLAAPIGAGLGGVWLAAAVIAVAAGVLLLARVRWWWIVGAIAVVVSQVAIATSWADAKAGTIANVIVLGSVVYGWASQGPRGARAEYRHRAESAVPDGRGAARPPGGGPPRVRCRVGHDARPGTVVVHDGRCVGS